VSPRPDDDFEDDDFEDDDFEDDDDTRVVIEHDGERVQKVLARAGIGSRRACEELIADGRVTVNGEVADLGRRVDTEHDRVAVDGTPIPVKPGVVHYLLNKPAGVVTTAADPQGRPTVVELVPDEPRVFPVGRLDQDTEGLLILTNDGDLTHRLTHPRFGVEKEYLAHVVGTPSRGSLRQLREGVELEDGMTAPAIVAMVAPGLLRITIHEGRNRQVRRMCDAIGHPVERLVRTRIGPIADRKLKPGTWRVLTNDEVMKLDDAAAADTDPRAEVAAKEPKRANRNRPDRTAAHAAKVASEQAAARRARRPPGGGRRGTGSGRPPRGR
jgi:23S rRNA pseudouridine2605 synthase